LKGRRPKMIVTKAQLKEVSNRIKIAQDRKGYSDSEMAGLLCISEIQYVKLLRGEHMISEDKFLILYSKLDISLDFLFTGVSVNANCDPDSKRALTEGEYMTMFNDVFGYVENLPHDAKRESMSEMLVRFKELFDSMR
jgi:transcriptional regulator with XRE-family HTH domain